MRRRVLWLKGRYELFRDFGEELDCSRISKDRASTIDILHTIFKDDEMLAEM